MSTKIKYFLHICFLLSLFALSASAQETQSIEDLKRLSDEDLKRRSERNELEIKVLKQEMEKRKLQDELKKTTDTPPTPVSPEQQQQRQRTLPQTGGGTSGATNTPQGGTGITGGGSSTSPQNADCTLLELQSNSPSFQRSVCKIINDVSVQNVENPLTPNNNGLQIGELLASRLSAQPLFLEAEKKRTDKQVGSTPEKSGTTSLVVKGGTPLLFGFAREHGAATSNVNGTTVTMRFNPYNLGKALFYNQGIIPIASVDEDEDAFKTFLRKLSVGISYDTSRGFPDTPTFTGNQQQISGYSLRYEFINHRNPLSKRNKLARDEFFASQTPNLDIIARSIIALTDRDEDRFKYAVLNEWLDETNRQLNEIPTSGLSFEERKARVTTIIQNRVALLPFNELSSNSEVKALLDNFAAAAIRFREGRNKFIDSLNDGTVVTFEYSNTREQIKPDTSNFRFIWEKGIFRGTDFTFNASLTMYNRKPQVLNLRRIRDFQFAAQLDSKLFSKSELGDFFLSFAGKYERLNTDTVDEMGVVKPGTKGDLAFGQIKLTIPLVEWGVRLPVSVTFANRSELIKESHVRANFGFTFDLDPVFAKFKPF